MNRRRILLAIIVFGLVLFAALTIIGALSAEAVNAQEMCSLETIKGTYVWAGQGVYIDGDSALPYAEAGIWTLDGAGNAQGVYSANIGTEAFEKQSFTATYTHVSDCVFEVIAPVGENENVEFQLYALPSGEIMTCYAPGFSGTHHRQSI